MLETEKGALKSSGDGGGAEMINCGATAGQTLATSALSSLGVVLWVGNVASAHNRHNPLKEMNEIFHNSPAPGAVCGGKWAKVKICYKRSLRSGLCRPFLGFVGPQLACFREVDTCARC